MAPFMDRIRKLRRRGLGGLWHAVSRRIYERIELLLATRDLSLPLPTNRRMIECGTRELDWEGLQQIDYISDRLRQNSRRYFDMGCPCYAVTVEDKVACFVFASFDTIHDPVYDFDVPVAPGQAYQFGGETDIRLRGRGVAIRLLDYYWAEMRERGITEAVAFFDAANRASYRFHQRMEFVPFRKIHHHRLLGFRWNTFEEWNPEVDSF